jgi:hypothetical protein
MVFVRQPYTKLLKIVTDCSVPENDEPSTGTQRSRYHSTGTKHAFLWVKSEDGLFTLFARKWLIFMGNGPKAECKIINGILVFLELASKAKLSNCNKKGGVDKW